MMKLLCHKNIANTLLYTQLVEFENDEFHSAIAKTTEEAQHSSSLKLDLNSSVNTMIQCLFRKRKRARALCENSIHLVRSKSLWKHFSQF